MIARRAFLSLPLLAADLRLPASEYIVLDQASSRITASHWLEIEKHVGMGSLLKPFLALAYARTHASFPSYFCPGRTGACWLPRGHGMQDAVSALAHSCNVYFLKLAAALEPGALEAVCLSYELNAPADMTPGRLTGLLPGWTQQPGQVAKAFSHLARDSSNSAVAKVLAGMQAAASQGTAQGIHLHAYAKTGTAPCTHLPQAPVDGFVIALYPCDQPRIALLVRQHGTTGAKTAFSAGRLLRTLA